MEAKDTQDGENLTHKKEISGTEAEKSNKKLSKSDHSNTSSEESNPLFLNTQDSGKLDKYDLITAKLDAITEHFEAKLKYDKHKETIIDKLHDENSKLKEDLYKKILKPLIMEIIVLYDDYQRMHASYLKKETEDSEINNLIKQLGMVHEDLEGILYKFGIEAYTCSEDGINTKLQKIIKTHNTNIPEQNNKVNQRLKKGFIWDGDIIRPEHISCYKYKIDL